MENFLNQQQKSSAVQVPVILMRPDRWKQELELKVIFHISGQPVLQEPLLQNEVKAKHSVPVPFVPAGSSCWQDA